MTKERARARERKRRQENRAKTPAPKWRLAIFIFAFILLLMGGWRVAMKGSAFALPDVAFVVLFASAMALVAFFRPKVFDK